MQGLLTKFSYKAAVISLVCMNLLQIMRHWLTNPLQALGYGLFGLFAVYFIRERIPVRRNRQAYEGADMPRRIPYTFLKRNTFYAFVLSILFTSLGNFLPSIYLPSYATDLGLSQSNGTLLVVMMK